jgi:endonuclease YncB( thermonuclease family)
VILAAAAFVCTPIAVWDGDGPIHCAEGPRIRLAGIAAREMDGTCMVNHPCPSASAEAARDTLVRLLGGATERPLRTGHIPVRGPRLTCSPRGSAGGKRTAAFCSLPSGADLSCEMLRARVVVRWQSYDRERRLVRC